MTQVLRLGEELPKGTPPRRQRLGPYTAELRKPDLQPASAHASGEGGSAAGIQGTLQSNGKAVGIARSLQGGNDLQISEGEVK